MNLNKLIKPKGRTFVYNMTLYTGSERGNGIYRYIIEEKNGHTPIETGDAIFVTNYAFTKDYFTIEKSYGQEAIDQWMENEMLEDGHGAC